MARSKPKIYTVEVERVRVYAHKIKCPKCGREFVALKEAQVRAQFLSHTQRCFDMGVESWQIVRKPVQR